MADMAQHTYNIFNRHLGEENRGKKQLPEKHREFLNEMHSLMSFCFRCGVEHGRRTMATEILNYAKETDRRATKAQEENWKTRPTCISGDTEK